jgi:segregation and condensation protein A
VTYRVELPVFAGPMDLLLHLVKEQEVDIHEVSISKILDDYLRHLEVLTAIDLADLGDFIVMAGTLMEIKSRELLPREEVSVEEAFDPRDDLIRRLLEYKRYRDLARRLDRFAARRAQMVPPLVPLPAELHEEPEEQDMLDLGEVDVWTLTGAFARLLEQTGQDRRMHVTVETRNVRHYTERILAVVRQRREVPFEALFEPGDGRAGVIGVLCAMLEMMKQGFLQAWQERPFDPIVVVYTGPLELTPEQVLALAQAEDEARARAAAEAGASSPEAPTEAALGETAG